MRTFREFLANQTQDVLVANLYLSRSDMTVREIASVTGRSIGEVYRVLKKHGGKPNRRRMHHGNVYALAEFGLRPKDISRVTGYCERYIRKLMRDR